MMSSTVLITGTSVGEDTCFKSSLHILPPVDNDKPTVITELENHNVSKESNECNSKLLMNGDALKDDTTHFEMEIDVKDEKEIRCFLKTIKQKHLTEKLVYVTSVGTMSLLTHSMISAQYLIPYYYAISTPILLLIRTIMYWFIKWQYFLLDFCYYGNVMCYVFLCAVPQQPQYFCVLFALTNGPILWSLVLFRNSLVFHSFDKTVSIFVHLMPSIVSFTIRWYPAQASKLWYTEFMPQFIDWSLVWLVAVPLGCFILHSLLYTILVMYILKPNEEYQTVYRLLTNKEDSFIYRSFNVLGPRYRYWIYKLYYWGFCLLSVIFTILWYNFFIAHCIFVIFVVVVATYNGACYYLEVFSVRVRNKRLSKEKSAIVEQ